MFEAVMRSTVGAERVLLQNTGFASLAVVCDGQSWSVADFVVCQGPVNISNDTEVGRELPKMRTDCEY